MTEGNVNVICFGSFPALLLLDENNENGCVVDVEENRQRLQEEEEKEEGGVAVAVGKESTSLSPKIGAKGDVNQEVYWPTFVEEEHHQESEHQNDVSNASSPRVSCSEEEKEEEEAAKSAEEASVNEHCCEEGAGSALETCISESNDNCNNGDDDCNDAAVRGPEIPRPLPPVLASADQRSITVAWEVCPMPVSYYLDTACNEVIEKSLKKVHYILSPSALDLKWTSVYCSNERNYKVERLKPGSSYSFRLRVVPITVPPLAPPPWPLPSEIAVFSTLPDAPCAPSTPILVNRARTSLKVRWSPPSETGGVPILEYILDITPLPGKLDSDVALPPTSDGFVQVYIGKDTAFKVTRLLPGSVYRFRVLAVNSIGRSEYSREACFSTDASVPAAPSAPTLVSTSATSMIVEWQEPQNCGSPINDYTLERDDGEGGPFVSVYTGEKRRFTMDGLRSGHVYRVRVMAHNDKGKGAFSVPAELLTGFSTPNPPPPPVITGRSTNSVIITWCSPERDGGSPITAFELEMRSGSCLHGQGPEVAATWPLRYYGLDNAHTLTGLSPGHQYRVRVQAVNLMGKSGYSGEASFSTSPGPPEPPSPPTSLEVGSSSLVLGWRPPAHDGGSSITSFRLEMTSLGQNGGEFNVSTSVREEHGDARSFVTIYRGVEARFVVEGLDPGSNYGFRVLAMNKLGSGPYSGLTILRTRAAPPTVPAAPVFTGNPFATSLTVRWYPSENNGAPIQSYSLQMLVLGYGGQCLPSFETGLSVNGYELQREDSCKHLDVASLGRDRGRSDTSSPFSHEMPQSPSHSVSSASSRGTSIWDTDKFVQKRKPLHSNAGTSEDESDLQEGLAKVGDERSLSFGSTGNERQRKLALQDVYYGSSTSHTIKKLQPFTSYAFRVQAHNEAGPSGFSSFVVGMTSSAAPSAPCAPTVLDTTSSSLTLRWEVPGQDNGSPVYRYILEMMKVGSNKGTLPIKERNNNTTNSGKKSSNRKNIKQDLAALTGGQSSGWGKVYDGDALEYNIVDLLPGNQYNFRVAAHNDMGTSPPSPSVGFTTLASAPEAPQSPLFSSITPTGVRIRWSAPACDNGMPVTSYKLMMDDGKGGRLRRVYEGAATNHKATKLVPASCYCVAVQAINALGASAQSEIGTVKLPIAPPRTPPTPKVKGASEKSVSVHWLEVPKDNESVQQPANSVHLSEGVAETVSYTLEIEDLKKAGKFVSLYEGSSTSFEVPNLVAEHKYRFRVRANGAQGVGSSPWSAWSSSITIARQPSTLDVKGKPWLGEDWSMSMTMFAQKARLQLQEPWSLTTQWWMALVGVALTLATAYFTLN